MGTYHTLGSYDVTNSSATPAVLRTSLSLLSNLQGRGDTYVMSMLLQCGDYSIFDEVVRRLAQWDCTRLDVYRGSGIRNTLPWRLLERQEGRPSSFQEGPKKEKENVAIVLIGGHADNLHIQFFEHWKPFLVSTYAAKNARAFAWRLHCTISCDVTRLSLLNQKHFKALLNHYYLPLLCYTCRWWRT